MAKTNGRTTWIFIQCNNTVENYFETIFQYSARQQHQRIANDIVKWLKFGNQKKKKLKKLKQKKRWKKSRKKTRKN